jgi:tetratricopeptide (TPR) repeat protein
MSRSAPSNRKARRAAQKRGKGAGPAQEDVNALVGLYRAGRLEEAIEGARRFTQRWPKQAVGWNVLAASHQSAGRQAEAAEAYRRAIKLEPGNADARNNLGMALAALGELEEAEQAYRGAIAERARFPEALYNLGLVLAERGRTEEARACHEQVLALQPAFVDAHNALGNLHAAEGRATEAEACYRHALQRQPGYAEVHQNLAAALRAQGRLEEALASARAAVERKPAHVDGHNELALVLAASGRPADAEAACDRALELQPGHIGARLNRAQVLRDQGRTDEAEQAYRDALAEEPAHREALMGLGNLLADLGRAEEAQEIYRRAIEIAPDDARLHHHLAVVKRFEPGDPELDAIEAQLAQPGRGDEDRAFLHYAAARAHADAGAGPDTVFAHYAAGARCKRATLDYDVAEDERRLQAIARVFDADWLARHQGEPGPGPRPVFIVGMPRSGTTLVEQMLASHPRVHGGGERSDLDRIVARAEREHGQAFPDWVPGVAPETLADLAGAYREAVLAPVTGVDCVTDKMPANFRYLGLIAAMLPEARMIHVQRDPADTCLSCFTYLFAGRQAFTYDLAELGRYYRAFDALMRHWRAVLPGERLHEVHYEDLVRDPEPVLRGVLEHCGLAWDPRCLEFHRTERTVRTASAEQVRQPLYQHAIGRWQPYRRHLEPLFEALGPLSPDAMTPADGGRR